MGNKHSKPALVLVGMWLAVSHLTGCASPSERASSAEPDTYQRTPNDVTGDTVPLSDASPDTNGDSHDSSPNDTYPGDAVLLDTQRPLIPKDTTDAEASDMEDAPPVEPDGLLEDTSETDTTEDSSKPDTEAAFTLDKVLPIEITRGSQGLVVLQGSSLHKITDVFPTPPDAVELDWDNRELLENNRFLRIPFTVLPDADPGHRQWLVEWVDGDAVAHFRIGLRAGEMQPLVGNGDLGQTAEVTPWEDSEFFQPVGVEIGEDILFFSDAGWNRIYASPLGAQAVTLYGGGLVLEPGKSTPLAGNGLTGESVDGTALGIPLSEPKGLCFARHQEQPLLYFADTTHHQIRVLNLGNQPVMEMGKELAPGHVVTLAGTGTFGFGGDGGPASEAVFFRPWRVRGCQGPLLFVGDVENYRLRAIHRGESPIQIGSQWIEPGSVVTVAGNGVLGKSGDGGPATQASISIPKGMAWVTPNLLAFSDPENDVLRMLNIGAEPDAYAGITLAPGEIGTLGQPGWFNGIDMTPGFIHPTGMRSDPLGGLWISDTYTQTIKYYNGGSTPLYRCGMALAPSPIPVALAGIEHFKAGGFVIGPALEQYLSSPFDVAMDPIRGELTLADLDNRVFRRLKLWTPYSLFESGLGPFPELPSQQSGANVLDGATGTLTLATGEVLHLGAQHGVFDFSSIHVPADSILRIVGNTPVALIGLEHIIIDGTVLVEAGALDAGPGIGGPSSGGSYGTQGDGPSPGTPYGTVELFPIAGGSAGGEGTPGGGALVVASTGPITVAGMIAANGKEEEGFGAGSGGAIRVMSHVSITGTGSIQATGGQPNGGAGRIRLEAPLLSLETSPQASTYEEDEPLPLPGY